MAEFAIRVHEYQPKKGHRCSKRPQWLTNLRASGTRLSVDSVWLQAGRHFADSIDPAVVGYNGSARQLATETAWRLVSMLRPEVVGVQLELAKPKDADIQRLSMEILGVGAGLELLRRAAAIDARTLKKVSSRFDFEAYSRGGTALLRIELKATLDAASRQEHRKSIQKKINHPNGMPRKKRSYDQRLGVIFLGWSRGNHGGVDFELADPPGSPAGDPEAALRAAAAFYARTYELVGVPGAQRFWDFSQDMRMSSRARKELFRVRGAVSPFSRVSMTMRFPDHSELVFGGSFWRANAVPFMREQIELAGLLLDYCFVGIDRRVVEAMASDRPEDILAMTWTEQVGSFDVEVPGGVLVPEGSRERHFRGLYHLSGDGLIYVWSNVIPADGTVDARGA